MIAIVQTAFLGDLLLSLPLARALSGVAAASDQKLALVCRAGLGELARATGFFETVIEVQKKSSKSLELAFTELMRLHANDPLQLMIVPHKSLRTRFWVSRVCRRLGGRSVGFRQFGFSWLFSEVVDEPRELPDALRQLALLGARSLKGFESGLSSVFSAAEKFREEQSMPGGRSADGSLLPVPDQLSMSCHLAQARSARPANLKPEALQRKGTAPRVAVAPGSVWATKRWREEHYIELVHRLYRKGVSVSLIGSPEEAELCQRIKSGVLQKADSFRQDGSSDPLRESRLEVLAGAVSLVETALFLSTVDTLVSNDSGAMHLASLSSTPTVAIFGPTVLDFGYRPWSSSATVVQPPRMLRCRPCGKHGHRSCPIGTHECMRSISVESVLRQVEGQLAARNQSLNSSTLIP